MTVYTAPSPELPKAIIAGDRLSALVTNELRTLMFAALEYEPETPQTISSLKLSLHDMQGDQPTNIPINYGNLYSHFNSLARTDLVEATEGRQRSKDTLSLTNTGYTIGRALAGHALRLPIQYGQPLTTLFGTSQSVSPNGTYPCTKRARIMEALLACTAAETGYLTQAYADGLAGGESSSFCLEWHERGLIERQKFNRNKPKTIYTPTAKLRSITQFPPENSTVGYSPSTVAVVHALKAYWAGTKESEEAPVTSAEVADYINATRDEGLKMQTVVGTLGRLVKQQYLRSVEPQLPSARITVNREQLTVIGGAFAAVEGVIHYPPTSDYLTSGHTYLKTILTNPMFVSYLLLQQKRKLPRDTEHFTQDRDDQVRSPGDTVPLVPDPYQNICDRLSRAGIKLTAEASDRLEADLQLLDPYGKCAQRLTHHPLQAAYSAIK